MPIAVRPPLNRQVVEHTKNRDNQTYLVLSSCIKLNFAPVRVLRVVDGDVEGPRAVEVGQLQVEVGVVGLGEHKIK